MKNNDLKQSEIFVFLALIFMLLAVDNASKLRENPPIITLSEEDEDFRFESGSAQLKEGYLIKLTEEIIPKIDSLSHAFECDAIQIIGHTSGSPVGSGGQSKYSSNLDSYLAETLHGPCQQLRAGSNVDLGMLRALSVMKVFRQYRDEKEKTLANIKYWLPYSAGPLILENGELIPRQSVVADRGMDHASRRRIEIRLFKYQKGEAH